MSTQTESCDIKENKDYLMIPDECTQLDRNGSVIGLQISTMNDSHQLMPYPKSTKILY